MLIARVYFRPFFLFLALTIREVIIFNSGQRSILLFRFRVDISLDTAVDCHSSI